MTGTLHAPGGTRGPQLRRLASAATGSGRRGSGGAAHAPRRRPTSAGIAKPASQRTAAEVQEWFKSHKGGKWAEYAHKFENLDGEAMSRLSKEEFHDYADHLLGLIIYKDWHLPPPMRRLVLNTAQKRPPVTESGIFNPEEAKYVHKAEVLSAMLGYHHMFLTGPRGMGKSTMLNMLHRLAIGNWEAFPPHEHWTDDETAARTAVIRLDMSAPPSDDREGVNKYIAEQAQEQHGVIIDPTGETILLTSWIEALEKDDPGRPIVVLVDEYDARAAELGLDPKARDAGAVDDYCANVLRPLFYATKINRIPTLKLRVIVCGVSTLAHSISGGELNHFRHAYFGYMGGEVNPDFARALAFSADELRETYPDLMCEAYRRDFAKKAAVLAAEGGEEAVLEAAVQHLLDHGGGWCLEPTGQREVICPIVANAWLEDELRVGALADDDAAEDRLTTAESVIETTWARTGQSGALVELLSRYAADVVLARRNVELDSLCVQRLASDYFSFENVNQLAFQFGYLSIEPGSWDRKAWTGPTVTLRPPNQGVLHDIRARVRESALLPRHVGDKLADAVWMRDAELLALALQHLAEAYSAAFGEPFHNEAGLHAWASVMAAADQHPVHLGFEHDHVSIRVDNEVQRGLPQMNELDDAPRPRVDALFHWPTPQELQDAGRPAFTALAVAWGHSELTLGTQLADKKQQCRDDRYLERSLKFLMDEHPRTVAGDFDVKVMAAVGKSGGCEFLCEEVHADVGKA